ncbi:MULTISPECIES: SulP family inorganic anion transporter [Oceanobacillus]|uniref:SulP family inorganic anion transporter n=1 Tax=Oceanobacillus aidingensis TaxID=645964 RepID=A0ABV9JXU4_9BACI|nr:SulP family inorganic anion transporter [Oceanobacillus oncorhynchi]MDM8100691.1 SulP family inorganic anion transporter [Oceanobacillus oncorhynchi]UUI42185.1 SulP family inorganic anion transporter [Oceanobacillus oncorhynchi]
MMQTLKQQWFGNIRADILSGIVVALALIPEAIAFSIIAGVDPMVGLYTSFIIAVVISFAGGRPGMISAATGAMALLMVPLVRDYGLDYLLAATILTGIIQLIFGICKVAKVMKFVPNAVMIGFVNALAILIFMAQLEHFIGISTMTYLFVGITLILLYTLPRFIKVIPAPLIAIVALTSIAIFSGVNLNTVGDLGTITQTLPSFFIPNVPWTFETLQIIFPYALSMAIVGLLETLLTSQIVDDMTGTESNKNGEARGQGIANFITGFFGGMAGCAMIGQSVINVKSGGRGRLSTFIAGIFLMFLIIVLGDLVVQIPMPVLVGIMIMVSIGTFDWSSFNYLIKAPRTDAIVMLTTVIIVVYTHDLSKGVLAGVLLSAIFFVIKISTVKISKDGNRYSIHGQLFFASIDGFVDYFKKANIQSKKIQIDFSDSRVWDDSGVGAILKVSELLKSKGIQVELVELDSSSKKIMDKLNGVLSSH